MVNPRCLPQLCQSHPEIWKNSCLPQLGNHTQNCGGFVQCPLDGHPLVVYHNCANHTLKYGSVLVYHNLAIILRTMPTWWAPPRCLPQLCQSHPEIGKCSCSPQLGYLTQNNAHLMGTPSLFTTSVPITPWNMEVFLFTTTWQSYSDCGGVIQGGLDGNPLVVYHNCANHTLKYGSVLVYHNLAIILRTMPTWWAPPRCLPQVCQSHPEIWKYSCLPQLGNHTQNKVHLMETPSLFTTIVPITPWNRKVFLFTTTW